MAIDLKNVIEEIEENATLTCSADAFGDDIINLLDAFDAEYLDLENVAYSFEQDADEYDEDDGFSDINKIIEQVLRDNDTDAKTVILKMIELKELMRDVIFCAKYLIDEGIKTCGNFCAEFNDYRQKFANATDLVRKLPISAEAQDQVLLSLAGRSSIINLLKRKERAHNLVVWNNGSAVVFDFKLQKICNDEYSPALKQAKIDADKKLFEFYRKTFYEETKKDDILKEYEK